MVAQKGKDLLLKVWSNAESAFVTVAGMRSRRIAFNTETVDVTDFESSGRWRQLLQGSGVQRASISGAGIFKDAASDALVRGVFFDGEIVAWQLIIPGFGAVSGAFQLTSLEYAGEHNGEVNFDLSLESAGAISFEGNV